MTQEPDRVIEESQLRQILLNAYQLKCAEVESLTARLAAQSGYAEDEELAALREDKARLDWLEQNVYSLSASWYSPRFVIWNQPNGGDVIDESIRALIDTVSKMGVPHHNPRKGAE